MAQGRDVAVKEHREHVVVLGAGGHAKVVIEILQANGETVDYCVSRTHGAETCAGVSGLEGDDHLPLLRQKGYRRAFVAIGSNAIRQRVADVVRRVGFQLINAISPHAIISPSVRLGGGIAVMAGAVINAASVVDDLVIINTGATIDHDCHIGSGVHIGPQCALAGNVTVGEGAFLGTGAKVIPGVQIGRRAIVGAGGVVIRNIPDGAVAVGVPARVIKQEYME
jgi:UDP-perosamine 4-acetyltransferase